MDCGPWTVTVTVSDGIGSDPGATTVNVVNVAPTVDTPTPDTIWLFRRPILDEWIERGW